MSKESSSKVERLRDAILAQDTQKIVELIVFGETDVNISLSDGETPLTLAVSTGNEFVVEALMGAEPDVNMPNSRGETPFSAAVDRGAAKMAMIFAETGADVNAVPGGADKAVSLIAQSGDLQSLKLLADKGIKIEDKDAVRGAVSSGQNSEGQTLLIQAVDQGDSQMLEWLVKNGADVNEKGGQGYTALTWAAGSSNIDISMMDYLIENGADPDLVIEDGRTALCLASESKALKAMECLVAGGANVNLEGESGEPPLISSLANGDLGGVQLLLASGAKATLENIYDDLDQMSHNILNNAQITQAKIQSALDEEVAHEMGDPDAKRSSLEAIANALVFSGSRRLDAPMPDEVMAKAISEAKRLDDIIQGHDEKTQDFVKSKIFLLDLSLTTENPKTWDVAKSGVEKALVNLAVLHGDKILELEQLSGASPKRVQAFISRIPEEGGKLSAYSVGEDELKTITKTTIKDVPKEVHDAIASFVSGGAINLKAASVTTKKRLGSASVAQPPAKRGRDDRGMGR